MAETMNVLENEELLNIVTVGHVDHGKSTVIGRLLADAGALPKGKLESIRENCRRNSKPFEYAFLLDALDDQPHTIGSFINIHMKADMTKVRFAPSRQQ